MSVSVLFVNAVDRCSRSPTYYSLQLRHNGRDGVSNHQPHDCLLNRLFRRRSKKTPKPRNTILCAGKSPVTGEFPAQLASNAENASIWWRHGFIYIGINDNACKAPYKQFYSLYTL